MSEKKKALLHQKTSLDMESLINRMTIEVAPVANSHKSSFSVEDKEDPLTKENYIVPIKIQDDSSEERRILGITKMAMELREISPKRSQNPRPVMTNSNHTLVARYSENPVRESPTPDKEM